MRMTSEDTEVDEARSGSKDDPSDLTVPVPFTFPFPFRPSLRAEWRRMERSEKGTGI